MRLSVAICVLVVALASIGGSAAQRSEFLYLNEIKVGMTGIGKTVVAGDVISEFAAEVLGVIDEPGTLSDFIVVRVSGEAIGRSGGIAQGMSGSPIYVGGKLIGALSRAATWSKEITPIGLVTPIEPMLAVLDSAKTVSMAPDAGSVLDGVLLVERPFAPSAAEVAAQPDAIFSYPVSTPLIAVGLSARSASALMGGESSMARPQGTLHDFLPAQSMAPAIAGLSSLSLELLPLAGAAAVSGNAGTGAASSATAPVLTPGGSLGVALVSGDITVGALGTVTYVDGNGVIGFGHPFISNGVSAFPLTTATIIDTMKALDASFKLGTIGKTIGVISEDRMAAIGGRIGGQASTIDLELSVDNLDDHARRTLKARVVDEPRLLPELLLSSGFEAIDSVLDRVGAGTVEVTYQITGDGMPSSLERKDVFLSTSDIALYPPWQLAEIVAFLQYNEFADPKITQISASMRVTSELRAIRIESLMLDNVVYSPGDTIQFTLVMQTFQGERIVRTGELTIPEDLMANDLVVRAYGGPRMIEKGEAPDTFESLADVIHLLETIPTYETATVELFAVDPYLSSSGEALYGVAKASHDYPGYVVYDERDVRALLLSPSAGGSQ
ncbi:MAG: hypothetical protein NTX23_04000 [Candidatus Bipolaricaulota bacterium]|nr:hypothetical protein [Candidatus Bipolaricaulota bacterium]